MIRSVKTLLFIGLAISLSAGCSCGLGDQGVLEVDAVNHPDITSDNTGGAYAVYQVYISQEETNQFYLQRISPDGVRLWGEKGVLIGEASGDLDSGGLRVLADDDGGGAIAAWCDNCNDVMSITKVNSQGKILWQKDIEGIEYASHIASDGAGGIIYILDDSGIQRVDAEGNLVWDRPGFLVEEPVSDRKIISDGFGGVFVITVGKGDEKTVYIQRIDSEGTCPWSQGTVSIFYRSSEEASGFSEEARACLATDGMGGAFVVWLERDLEALSFPEYLMSVLRLSQDGDIIWQKRNLPGGLVGYDMFVVTDNDGNALVFWEYATGLGAQKISPEGELLWPSYGRYTLDGFSYNVVANGDNGAIIGSCSMYDGRSLTAQIIDEYGKPLFPESVAVSDDNQVNSWKFMMAADGEGGALFAWGSSENVYSIERSSVQRINAEGELLWGDSGISLDDWNQ
jgi:hypothetical protein